MAEYEEYLERIDKFLVRENYNIGLGFKDGFIFYRCLAREIFPLLYDPFAEITNFAGAGNIDMPSGTYITAKELPSTTLSTTNIFRIDYADHMYQVFYGFSPGICRIFPAYPRETEINQLDEGLHTTSYPIFGFVDGFESPMPKPSPRTQFFVPRGPLVGFAFYNYGPYNIKPMIRFIIQRLKVQAIKDPDLVQKIIDRRVECTFTSVGGLDNPWGTSKKQYEDWWGVDPISLLATKDEIAAALSPPGASGA